MIIPFDGKDVLPYRVTTLDIETSPNGEVIGIGFAYEKEGYNRYAAFEDTESWYYALRSLLASITDRNTLRRYCRIFAHNGANFDYLKLYEDFSTLDIIEDAQYFSADSTGIGFMVKFKDFSLPIYFMDSYRLLPASLKQLGKTYGTEIQKQEIPIGCEDNYEKFKELFPALFWHYLRCDVLGLQEIILSFWNEIYNRFGNVGQLPMTLPALSMRIFSKQLQEPMMVPENEELKAFERRAYKGGLTLCIKTGVYDNVNVYDVNSMYPAAMAGNNYPCDYHGYWTNEFEPQSIGLWEMSYEHDEKIPPYLFDEVSGASYCGTGIFTTQEICYLTTLHGSFTLKRGYVYEKTAPIFREFISTIYEERKQATLEGDEAKAFTYKIMMNSLYGKFAQREKGAKIEWFTYEKLDAYVEAGKRTKIMGDFLVTDEERKVPHVFVAIAAMITANARIDLHRRIMYVLRRGFNVYYCDTDSIHTNGQLPDGTGLGDVKLENTGTAAYAGRKLYAFKNGKIKAKGIGRRTVGADLTYEDIELLALNKDIQKAFTFGGFPSMKGVLSKKEDAAVMRLMTRTIRNTGGIFDDSNT